MTAARLSLSWPKPAVPRGYLSRPGGGSGGQLGDRADDGVIPGQDGARIDLAESEGPGHDGHGQRCGQAAAQVAPPRAACRGASAGAPRAHRADQAVRFPGHERGQLVVHAGPAERRAERARCRSWPGPSSESMLGPTIRAVEKRGSSTVKVALSRITAAARSTG